MRCSAPGGSDIDLPCSSPAWEEREGKGLLFSTVVVAVAPGFILLWGNTALGNVSTHKGWVSKLNSALVSSSGVLMLD